MPSILQDSKIVNIAAARSPPASEPRKTKFLRLCIYFHSLRRTKPLRGRRVRRVFRNPELLLRFLGTPIARTWSSCKWQLAPTRKGVSNDATSAAYDRGHAGAEPIGEYTGVISSASLAVRLSF